MHWNHSGLFSLQHHSPFMCEMLCMHTWDWSLILNSRAKWCRRKTSYLHLTSFSGGQFCSLEVGYSVLYSLSVKDMKWSLYERKGIMFYFPNTYRVSQPCKKNCSCRWVSFASSHFRMSAGLQDVRERGRGAKVCRLLRDGERGILHIVFAVSVSG